MCGLLVGRINAPFPPVPAQRTQVLTQVEVLQQQQGKQHMAALNPSGALPFARPALATTLVARSPPGAPHRGWRVAV